jgi:opacity protein-like surface antigen
MKKFLLAAAALACLAGGAQAEETKALNFYGIVGVTAGGDKLYTAYYTNGDSVDIHAGGLFQFGGGIDYRFNDQFSLQFGVNYHVDQASAKNGDIEFSRWPIELIGHYHFNESWRIGAGARFVNGAKISGSGFASAITDTKADNTVGLVLEGEYFFNPHFSVKVRGVSEKYQFPGVAEKTSGNHIGAFAGFYF